MEEESKVMARPRTSAAILQLRGSFKNHPERAREDLPGAGPFDESPPDHLSGKERAAWKEIVAALPRIALSDSERLGIEQMARIRAAIKDTDPRSSDWAKLDSAFRQWAMQMGMTVAARARLGTSAKRAAAGKFADLKNSPA
jgi:hypothetical protein